MTDKKLEEILDSILTEFASATVSRYKVAGTPEALETRPNVSDTIEELLDLLKQERNKVLDQLEADVKDTVTIFSETVPADPEWLPLSLLLKAIKKLKEE